MVERLVDAIGHGATAAAPPDSTPPFVTNQVPAPGATGISANTNIALRIDDDGDGVDLTTVTIEIDTGSGFQLAYDGGFQAGFNGPGSSVNPGGIAGFDFVIDPTTALSEFAVISVRVNATDLAPLANAMPPLTYAFTTADLTAPVASNRVPAPGAQDDSFETTNISVRVDDPGGSGVVLATINVQVQNGPGQPIEDAIINGVFQAPYNGAGSQIVAFGSTGYNVTIDRTSDYVTDNTVSVTLQAEDLEGNSLNAAWSFSTADPPPPPAPEPIVETIAGFPLDMYRFILFEIRRQDLFGSPKPGSLFLQRYLEGPNSVWQQIVAFIQSIPELWDVTLISDDKLQFLKAIVGWTNEPQLKKVTDAISDDALRRLIAVSGRLWRTRGPEDTIVNVLRILTVARLRIWNWFDFRWVLDETGLGEEHDGRDPWLIDLPGSVEQTVTVDQSVPANRATGDENSATMPSGVAGATKSGDVFILQSGPQNGYEAEVLGVVGNVVNFVQGVTNTITGPFANADWIIVDRQYQPDDEYRSNLRIVDNGSLDRTLVRRILAVMRASGERWDITYLSFLDQFSVEGDDLQWEPIGGENLLVEDGLLRLIDSTASEATFAIVPEAATWTEYVIGVRMRGTSDVAGARFGFQFYREDASNYYAVLVDTFDQEIRLRSVVAGVPSDLVTVDLSAIGFPIIPNVFYLLRATIVDEGATNRIQLHIDGFELINTTNPDHAQGTIGLLHDVDASFEIDEVEMFELSQGTDTLEINELP